ncbi:DNA polymerase III subunit gamma/tau [Weissella viridescens]|uniref:DNA polymerase III subunit gamma/tau n=1 Tax=Weissella viridescens TaxID=1629 RepID=UPI001D08CC12|nr:DNA polymerase III subunit gamma/tau [Weissella viridescens]MCB6840318.1 DNA polymerase III subunit gamma/tau [Weissella viridescens]MCB6847050.1 DNA polymerase III subunit gamma/tau [Weissella viridescens]
MAYQALYRTWRPQKFSDMIGQEVVTRTLRNTIISNQITHAYLFSGPRGTGKTSAAKIFAKAVNCLHPIDGEPDDTCEICLAINDGSFADVIEMDAASNNGVDEIRQIREDVNYAPTQGKYKVYIIDEVHMLSTGAFNALLKTLEEPPANVIFILATTEPQKIPATIISRTQRFDFKRINAQDAMNRMVYILDQVGDKYDEDALRVIANAADGGMRDALSILDQVLSFGDDTVTLENALLVTGSVTQSLLGEYVQAVQAQDTKLALAKVEEILDAGKDVNRFVEDLISYARDLLLYTEAPDLITLVPDDNFKQLAQNTPAQTWYRMIDILSDTQQQLRYTNRPSVYLEVLTVKLSADVAASAVSPAPQTVSAPATTEQTVTTSNVTPQSQAAAATHSAPVSEASVSMATTSQTVATKASNSEKKPVETKITVLDDQAAVFNVLREATRGDLSRVQTIWSDLVNSLPVPQQAMLNVARPIAASPDGLVVAFDFDIIRINASRNNDLLTTMTQQLRVLTESKTERQLVFITNEQWPEMRSAFVQATRGDQSAPQAPTKPQPVADDPGMQGLIDEVEQADQSEPEDPAVNEARAIFGQELVETQDD